MPELSAVERAVAGAGGVRDGRLRDAGDDWRARGVVHTPSEVARFVVSRVDRMLVRRLGLRGGLADRRVAIVDPACGPGAFLAAVLGVAARRRSAPGRFLGIDLDPDAVGAARHHLRPAADRAGFPLELRVGDTLADVSPFGAELPADAVVVVLGNPPWASKSANRDAATAPLLEDFRRDAEGQRLPERKIGVLSDDYVRFFRWAIEVVRRAPAGGALGLATNGSFLDGPVHAGMRGALLRWLDAIDVVDLGGSALLSRGEDEDQNVFGVRPSVALTLGVRAPALAGTRRALVRHVAISGTRPDKLRRLSSDDVELARVRADAPGFYFVPTPSDSRYEGWPSMDAIFRFHAEGVQTNRDDVVVDADPARLLARVRAFVEGSTDEALTKARTASAHYDPEVARARLATALAEAGDAIVQPIAYRPFDDRWFVPVTPFCHRPRPKLAAAIAHGGPVVLTVRKDRGKQPWTHFAVVNAIPDNCYLSNRSSCRTRAFPTRDPRGAENLDPVGAEPLLAAAGGDASAADVAMYVLAVLSATGYRQRYDAFLRLSYPHIVPPRDPSSFREVRDAGRGLVAAFAAGGAGVGTSDPVSVGHHQMSAPPLRRAVAHATEVVESLLGGD